MANFDAAIKVVLKNEGGYVNDVCDAGGRTNFGICARDNPTMDIEHLTEASATKYYLNTWWTPNNFALINDDQIACYFFDHAVNVGMVPMTKIVQTVIQDIMHASNVWTGISIDGVLGPITASLINKYLTKDSILKIQEKLWGHYQRIIEAHPEDQKYYHGWHNRTFQNI